MSRVLSANELRAKAARLDRTADYAEAKGQGALAERLRREANELRADLK